MSKWADYIITGVWFRPGTKIVEYVYLRKDDGDTIGNGRKTHKNDVIKLIDNKQSVITARWNYESAKWSIGAFVHVVTQGNERYLRTNPDAEKRDNLDNQYDLSKFKANEG